MQTDGGRPRQAAGAASSASEHGRPAREAPLTGAQARPTREARQRHGSVASEHTGSGDGFALGVQSHRGPRLPMADKGRCIDLLDIIEKSRRYADVLAEKIECPACRQTKAGMWALCQHLRSKQSCVDNLPREVHTELRRWSEDYVPEQTVRGPPMTRQRHGSGASEHTVSGDGSAGGCWIWWPGNLGPPPERFHCRQPIPQQPRTPSQPPPHRSRRRTMRTGCTPQEQISEQAREQEQEQCARDVHLRSRSRSRLRSRSRSSANGS